jgi:hypothetical protein
VVVEYLVFPVLMVVVGEQVLLLQQS